MTAPSNRTAPETSAEIGKDDSWFANIKRTYDEFLQESLAQIRVDRAYMERIRGNHEDHDNALRQTALQCVQAAVETQNMTGKAAVKHSEIAADHMWNLEPSEAASEAIVMRSVTIDDASLKAIGAVVAVAVADALTEK